MIFKR